jgi:hypothetical protein
MRKEKNEEGGGRKITGGGRRGASETGGEDGAADGALGGANGVKEVNVVSYQVFSRRGENKIVWPRIKNCY